MTHDALLPEVHERAAEIRRQRSQSSRGAAGGNSQFTYEQLRDSLERARKRGEENPPPPLSDERRERLRRLLRVSPERQAELDRMWLDELREAQRQLRTARIAVPIEDRLRSYAEAKDGE